MKTEEEDPEAITSDRILAEVKAQLAEWTAALQRANDEQGREAAVHLVERQLFDLFARAYGWPGTYDDAFPHDTTITDNTDRVH